MARERLTGYLYTLHRRGQYDENTYLLLGEVYFSMRDFARAGAAWLLTRRDGPDAQQAFDAFHKRYGHDPANMLHQVKPHAPSEDYPEAVQQRLKSWGYRYTPYRPRSNPHVSEEHSGEEPRRGLRPLEIGCLLLIVLTLVLIALNFLAGVRGK